MACPFCPYPCRWDRPLQVSLGGRAGGIYRLKGNFGGNQLPRCSDMYNVTVILRTQAVQEARRPRWALYKLTAKMIHDHEDIDNQSRGFALTETPSPLHPVVGCVGIVGKGRRRR